MAGHSKWANIKHKKAANDKKRAKVWTKIIREITVAAREGKTSDPNAHPRLRLAVDKALGANMTKDTIERACKRGAGETEGANYEEIRYEGYGPGGVAVIVDCMTDNRNRTVSEVRHAFTKSGGNLGTDGSVAYMFNKIGVITYAPDTDEDTVMEVALEAGAEDVISEDDGSIEVITSPEEYTAVNKALKEAGLVSADAEITLRANLLTTLNFDDAEKLLRLIDVLEDLDDVQEVYSNADIPDEILERME
ncbi:MAG: YebC/PmpR family DNA-binding transcriptional regulator [Aquificaceae bacterium]|nr:MAG: YebC/PmpR family DNA-binding transcriptional regulator [Aquificaceae bacterium]